MNDERFRSLRTSDPETSQEQAVQSDQPGQPSRKAPMVIDARVNGGRRYLFGRAQ
jgi:hypothetical protein